MTEGPIREEDRSPHSPDVTGAIHRQLVAEGGLSGPVMGGIAAEALGRGDLELFTHVTQTMQQSGDPDAMERAGMLLERYADIAEGKTPPEAGAPEIQG